jgi:hypothetical protein
MYYDHADPTVLALGSLAFGRPVLDAQFGGGRPRSRIHGRISRPARRLPLGEAVDS